MAGTVFIDPLVQIEQQINALRYQERRAMRQQKSKPLFDDMRNRCSAPALSSPL